jgi:aspartate dehydrogenase
MVGVTTMRVGLIGLGAIGAQVVDGLTRGAAWADVELVAILTRQPRGLPMAVTDLTAFLAAEPEVVVEAASAEAVTACAEPILTSGASMVVASSAALMDAEFRARLEAVCRASGVRLYVPFGALIGLDALAAAARGGLESVTLNVMEPRTVPGPPRVVFHGSAHDGARQFPGRLNVAATAALAIDGDLSVTLTEVDSDQPREITLAAASNSPCRLDRFCFKKIGSGREGVCHSAE